MAPKAGMDTGKPTETLGEIVVSRSGIAHRTERLGDEISRDYAGHDLLIVGILAGAAFFAADLSRCISVPAIVDWMRMSAYGMGDTSDGTVRMLSDTSVSPRGRDVLIVEDILDSGLTLHHLFNHFNDQNANSVEACTLLRKPGCLKYPVEARYVGFDIDVHWVAGNGIDYAERYRQNPDIREVRIV